MGIAIPDEDCTYPSPRRHWASYFPRRSWTIDSTPMVQRLSYQDDDAASAGVTSFDAGVFCEQLAPIGKRFEVPQVLHLRTRTSAQGFALLVLLFSISLFTFSSRRSSSHLLQTDRLVSLSRRITDLRLTPFIWLIRYLGWVTTVFGLVPDVQSLSSTTPGFLWTSLCMCSAIWEAAWWRKASRRWTFFWGIDVLLPFFSLAMLIQTDHVFTM